MKFIGLIVAFGLLAHPALAGKPGSVSSVAPSKLGETFHAAGVDWQRVEGVTALPVEAVLAPAADAPVTRGAGETLARVGPWRIVATGSTRAAGQDALTVVWDARRQRYGILTGEVIAFSPPGSAGPSQNLPPGLVFERSLPRLGLNYYRLQGGNAETVRRLAALPGVIGAEAVVKTGRAIAH